MQVLRRTYGTTATEKKKANLRPLLFTLETTPLWLVDDAILLVRRALVRMFLPTAGQLAVPFDRIVRSVLESPSTAGDRFSVATKEPAVA